MLFLEHKRLYSIKGEVGDEPIPLGSAAVVREGADVTIVTAMKGVHDALEAAEGLSGQGIEATVIDLRTLRPLDADTVVRSVEETNRLLVVEEGPETGGWAGEVLARVAEQALGSLDVAWRLTTPDLPIPYSPPLEDAFLPGAGAIEHSVLDHLAGRPHSCLPAGWNPLTRDIQPRRGFSAPQVGIRSRRFPPRCAAYGGDPKGVRFAAAKLSCLQAGISLREIPESARAGILRRRT